MCTSGVDAAKTRPQTLGDRLSPPASLAPAGRSLLFGGLANLFGTANHTCADEDESCAQWARDGECGKNAAFMTQQCAASCGTCGEAAASAPGRQLYTPPRTPRTRGSCADEAEYGCAARAAGGECDSDKANMLYRCPRACGVCGFIRIVDEAFGCDDANPSCRQWADAGECAANPGYMHENCATACGSCEQKRRACNRPPDTPPAVGPGDIDATYRRIMSDFPQYSPRALSRPGDARFVARNSAQFGALRRNSAQLF